MLKQLELLTDIYGDYDCITITNKEGIVEYSVRFDQGKNKLIDEGYTGKHVFDIYPNLRKEESSSWRILQNGKPIINEFQTIIDFNGVVFQYIISAYPIIFRGEIIGVVEGNTILSVDGERYQRNLDKNNSSTGHKYYDLDDIVTNNENMKAIKEKIQKVAKGYSSIMVIGDTGTGKELVAQAIHSNSLRAKRPFVAQNCSAIPSTLLESILFGTVKGSYTGAMDRKGLFELADGGSLFLDELNSLDITLQGKVLKALETNAIRRVGSEKEIAVNVRIISAMNEDPFTMIEEKRLRSDLFYRLGVIQINLPKLKERKEDILLLTHYFINKFNQEQNKKVYGLSEIVEKRLLEYHWPGNIRELSNTIEYAFSVMSGNTITINDMPEYILYSNKDLAKNDVKSDDFDIGMLESKSFSDIVEEYEKKILESVLSQSTNMNDAAKKLKMTRQVLKYKMTKYQLDI